MIADVKAKVDQVSPDVLTEGSMEYPRLSNIGQLFTADWKMRLILAGRVYRMSMGTITGSAAHALIGVGTTTDLDMPMGLIAVDSGFLIPMSLNYSGISDTDAENDYVDILMTADRATAVSGAEIAAATGTVETPDNLLDGGEAFSGRAVCDTTVEISDPVHSDLLYFATYECLGTDPLVVNHFHVDHEFAFPTFLAGPCSLLFYAGGTEAVTGMGSIVFAHIPSSWVPIPD